MSHATICRWARDGGWKRPPFAPRANDLMPTPRASAQLRRRKLAARLDALAERHIRELEESQCVDPDKLGEALELLRMAKLAARPPAAAPRRRSARARGIPPPDRPALRRRPRPLPRAARGGGGFSGEPRSS